MPRKAVPNRKDDIIQAASRVFAQKGYASTRMIEVAEAASVGKGTIYEYFRSKEALFFAVFEAMMAESTGMLIQMAEATGGSFSTRMRALNDGIIQSWLDQLSMYGLVMEFWSATASSPDREHFKAAFQEGYRELKAVIGDIIRNAQDAGEVADDIDTRQSGRRIDRYMGCPVAAGLAGSGIRRAVNGPRLSGCGASGA